MKKVLLVIGTSHFDLYDLCEALQKEHGADCTICRWNEITDPLGHYNLAVLFGLTPDRNVAHRYARAVREAIGPDTGFLVVSSWDAKAMAALMRQEYDAQYEPRGQPIDNLLSAVVKMLNDAKTAP